MMFEALHKLASEGNCNLMLLISAKGDNLVVRLVPQVEDKSAPTALTKRLDLEATPAEFDEQFISLIHQYSAARKSLQQAVADAREVMDAAAKEETKKAADAVKNASGKSTVAAPVQSKGKDKDGQTGKDSGAQPTVPAVADTKTIALF